MTDPRAIIGENLKALRKVRKMPQVVLADAAGIDRSFISDTENGRYGISIDKVGSLAEALGVEPWELLHPDTAKKYKGDAD
jgi:transcriptional regulator with XRE-family HTH domain